MPEMYTEMFNQWVVEAKSLESDWRYLPVREIVDFAQKKFLSIANVGVEKRKGSEAKKAESKQQSASQSNASVKTHADLLAK